MRYGDYAADGRPLGPTCAESTDERANGRTDRTDGIRTELGADIADLCDRIKRD